MKGILIATDTKDLLVENGTLEIGDIDAQIAEMVLQAVPGEFKEFPRLGAAAPLMLGGSSDAMWCVKAHRMLRAAGVEVTAVSVANDGTITIS